VGNLSQEVTDNDLQELFAAYGNVKSAKVIRDLFSGGSKGFGFVEMATQTEAEKAIAELNSKELKGKRIVVNEARPQKDNRRGGSSGGRRGNRGNSNSRGGGRRGW